MLVWLESDRVGCWWLFLCDCWLSIIALINWIMLPILLSIKIFPCTEIAKGNNAKNTL